MRRQPNHGRDELKPRWDAARQGFAGSWVVALFVVLGCSASEGTPGGGTAGALGEPTLGGSPSQSPSGGSGAGAEPQAGRAGTAGAGGTASSGAGGSAGEASQGGAAGNMGGSTGGAVASSGGETTDAGAGGAVSGQGGSDAVPDEPYFDTTTFGRDLADTIMDRWPNANDIAPGKEWEYSNAVVLYGIEKIYDKTADAKYIDYIRDWVNQHVNSSGTINGSSEHNVDRIQPSTLLPSLFTQYNDARYKTAAESTYARYAGFPVNSEGGYWHKQNYPNEMWLDSVFMAQPFLARYASVFECGDCFAINVEQITLIAEHTFDPNSGVFRHGWDGDANAAWADRETGISPEAWSRGMGWLAVALVDVLALMPSEQPGRDALLAVLQEVALGIQATQDASSGLWYQVLDKSDRADNWVETSGSAMFVYALKQGVDLGFLEGDYLDVALAGWEGLKKTFERSGNSVSVTGAVEGMGIQVSYADYVSKQRLTNSPHGLAAALLATSAMESYD